MDEATEGQVEFRRHGESRKTRRVPSEQYLDLISSESPYEVVHSCSEAKSEYAYGEARPQHCPGLRPYGGRVSPHEDSGR
eukprot:g758.t1